jgi:hypothetical protein
MMNQKTAAAILASAVIIALASHARAQEKQHSPSDYTHTAVFSSHLWTAGPDDRNKMVCSANGPPGYGTKCDNGYQTVVEPAPSPDGKPQQPIFYTDTKVLFYVSVDGGKPLLVDGPKREGTTPCRLVPDSERHGMDIFIPRINKKGKIVGEVEYTTK